MANDRAPVARRRNSGITVPTPRTLETPPTPPPDEGHQPRRDGDSLFISFPAPHVFSLLCCCLNEQAPVTAEAPQGRPRHANSTYGQPLCPVWGHARSQANDAPLPGQWEGHHSPTQQWYQCNDFTLSFSSRKGMNNHVVWHKKEEAKRLRATSCQQSTTPGDTEGENEEQPPSQATPPTGGAASRQNAQDPSIPERGDGEESQQRTPRLTNTPLPQASGHSTPSQSDQSATPSCLFSQDGPSQGRVRRLTTTQEERRAMKLSQQPR
ncbi:hypothetical protein HPB48_016295 [Haemaphysalis longicornis]|uniref:Uncharacterized protein n=1 Tax=Haemaphysalis longicornis TaxID=44386 RepID=A0A9J6GVB0_HAELO|nr:hypothetical protein HPB48_016295 [Haemaphysalis longicornis]